MVVIFSMYLILVVVFLMLIADSTHVKRDFRIFGTKRAVLFGNTTSSLKAKSSQLIPLKKPIVLRIKKHSNPRIIVEGGTFRN